MVKTIPQTIVVRTEEDGKSFGVYCQELRPLAHLDDANAAGETAVSIAETFGVGVAADENVKKMAKQFTVGGSAPSTAPKNPTTPVTGSRTRVTGVADKIRELIKAGDDDTAIIRKVLPMYVAAGKKSEDVTPTLKAYVKEIRGKK